MQKSLRLNHPEKQSRRWLRYHFLREISYYCCLKVPPGFFPTHRWVSHLDKSPAGQVFFSRNTGLTEMTRVLFATLLFPGSLCILASIPSRKSITSLKYRSHNTCLQIVWDTKRYHYSSKASGEIKIRWYLGHGVWWSFLVVLRVLGGEFGHASFYVACVGFGVFFQKSILFKSVTEITWR